MSRRPDPRDPHRIELRIDRVVLTGLALEPRDQERFHAGLEVELARLLVEHGLPGGPTGTTPRDHHDASWPTPHVDLRGGTLADGAAQVAQQVFDSVQRAVRS